MANKTGLGYSELTDRVYLGKQNPEKRLWVGKKTNVTNDFIAVSLSFYKEGIIREIECSDGSVNLFINIKKDKASIERLIKNLTKRVAKMK